jgi:hypothetical protein
MNQKLYGALLLASLIAGIAGVLTLIPSSGATYPNVFGYRSLCTFTPAASLYCFSIAGAICVIRASLVKRAAFNNGKPVFKAAPVVVWAVVVALAVASHLWIGSVRAQYTDGTAAATEQPQ